MKAVSIKDVLLNSVAVDCPPVSELTRKISATYQMAYSRVADDPQISPRDLKIAVGNTRLPYVNTDLIQWAQQYPDLVSYAEKMEGEEGYNNRVELVIGNFLVTAHHQCRSLSMPEDFVNVSSSYGRRNWGLNDELQAEMFPLSEIVKPSYRTGLLNLLILHETSDEFLGEIGNLEFVFPKKGRKHIVLTVDELVAKQGEILDLNEEDLQDFKLKSAEELKRLVG